MTLRQTAERLVVRMSSLPGLRAALGRIARHEAVIFMLHRMQDPRSGVEGHDPAVLRQCLALIRKMKLELVSVQELLERANSGVVGKTGLVAFSLDDGYEDQAEIAGPIFAEFDCAATYFLITGLIDGELWPWDARLEYALLNMPRPEISVTLAGRSLALATGTAHERQRAKRLLRGLLKFYPQTAIDVVVADICAQAGLDPTLGPPAGYTPMSWSGVRRLEQRGMRFAPHTVSHGIVARMDDMAARFEIEHSWRRICDEVSHPQRVFAWPNGRDIDAGPREYALLKKLGFVGAVTTERETVRFDPDVLRQPAASVVSPAGRIGLPGSALEAAFAASGPGKSMSLLSAGLDARYGGLKALLQRWAARAFKPRYAFGDPAVVDWRAVRRLVFVCHGNICRSAFAAQLAKDLGLAAVSYGTDARTGAPADDRAIRAGLRKNVDLRAHRSRRFDVRELHDGDLILIFDETQAKRALMDGGSASVQTSLVGLWGRPQWTVIPDPYGRTDGYFNTCFDYIEVCVRRVAALLHHRPAAT